MHNIGRVIVEGDHDDGGGKKRNRGNSLVTRV